MKDNCVATITSKFEFISYACNIQATELYCHITF